MARRVFCNSMLSAFLTLAVVVPTRADDPSECPRPLTITDNPKEIVFKFPFDNGLRVEWKHHAPPEAEASEPTPHRIRFLDQPHSPAGLSGGFGLARLSPRLTIPLSSCWAGDSNSSVKPVEFAADSRPLCPPCPLPPVTPNPLLGTWHRDSGMGVVTAHFTHDELKITFNPAEAKDLTLTMTAHYTLMKDGLVYGAITGADVEWGEGLPRGGEMLQNITRLRAQLQSCSDLPFSFRTKSTSLGVMVSGVKFPLMEGCNEEVVQLLGGLYKSSKKPLADASPTVAPPWALRCDTAAATPSQRISSSPPMAMPQAPATLTPRMIPPAQPLDTTFAAPMMPPMSTAPAPRMPPAQPLGMGGYDPMKQMASDAFNELLKQSGVKPVVGMMLPPDHNPCPGAVAVEPAAGCVVPKSAVAMDSTPRSALHGTWYRQLSGCQCVITLADGQMTITQSFPETSVDGECVLTQLIITADYHLTRDGTTIVGLISGVDLTFDGPLSSAAIRELQDTFQKLAEIKAQIEEKPFAMACRTSDNTLMIGNIRLPSSSFWHEVAPASFIGGRYTNAGGQPVPNLKPTPASKLQKLK